MLSKPRRRAVAAVEFGVVSPVLFIILCGIWEVGRVIEVENVMCNCAREGARDASMGQASLSTVAANMLLYLQSAEPTAFRSGDSTKQEAVVITLAANTYGYTYWDTTRNCELFTITFTDVTTPTVTDPTGMSQLDRYQISVSTPYTSVGWIPVSYLTGMSRISVTVNWVSMVDSPFTISPYLQAQ